MSLDRDNAEGLSFLLLLFFVPRCYVRNRRCAQFCFKSGFAGRKGPHRVSWRDAGRCEFLMSRQQQRVSSGRTFIAGIRGEGPVAPRFRAAVVSRSFRPRDGVKSPPRLGGRPRKGAARDSSTGWVALSIVVNLRKRGATLWLSSMFANKEHKELKRLVRGARQFPFGHSLKSPMEIRLIEYPRI